jgi:hypothetical protein
VTREQANMVVDWIGGGGEGRGGLTGRLARGGGDW